MNDEPLQKLTIEAGKSASVSALLTRPQPARACFVFAHGAGAGMTHPFMETVATGDYGTTVHLIDLDDTTIR
jgi:uncharacterized protein